MDIVIAFAVLLLRIVFEDSDDDEIWLRKLRAEVFQVTIFPLFGNVFKTNLGKPSKKTLRRISF